MQNFTVQMNDYNDNPVDVPMLSLIQWKSAIKLEDQGMKHSSGRSITAHVRRVLSIPRNVPRNDIVTYLKAVIEEVHTQLKGAPTPRNRTRRMGVKAQALNERAQKLGGHLERGDNDKGWSLWIPSGGGSVDTECRNLSEVESEIQAIEEARSGGT